MRSLVLRSMFLHRTGQSSFAAAALALLLLPVMFPVFAAAKSTSDYREEVSHLRKDFAALLESDADTDQEEFAHFEAEVFEEIRDFSGDREPIIYGGSEVVPDNAWIIEKWNEYRTRGKDGRGREAVLLSIYERLSAIESRIVEYENSAVQGPAKDQNKRDLAEILNGDEFRGAPADGDESIVARITKWIEEWLRGLFPAMETPEPDLRPSGPGTFGYVLQIVLYCLIAAALGYLLYRFGPEILRRAKARKENDDEERIVLGEKIEAGRSTADLFSEAERLVAEGRLREALRKGYIALLFGLGEKRRISIARHKTNRDYLNDLRTTDIHPRMTELTLQYEEHWYGSSEANEADWTRFAGGFDEVLSGKAGSGPFGRDS